MCVYTISLPLSLLPGEIQLFFHMQIPPFLLPRGQGNLKQASCFLSTCSNHSTMIKKVVVNSVPVSHACCQRYQLAQAYGEALVEASVSSLFAKGPSYSLSLICKFVHTDRHLTNLKGRGEGNTDLGAQLHCSL